VRHQEEVELAINDLRLLNEAGINIGSLRRVVDEVLAIRSSRLLEEALSDALVDDDEGDIGRGLSWSLVVTAILHGHDAIKLGQLLVNDLLAHGVTHTITIDENVTWHGPIVELTIGRESALEIVRQDGRRNNFLALDWL
jgi:hypothetical protein